MINIFFPFCRILSMIILSEPLIYTSLGSGAFFLCPSSVCWLWKPVNLLLIAISSRARRISWEPYTLKGVKSENEIYALLRSTTFLLHATLITTLTYLPPLPPSLQDRCGCRSPRWINLSEEYAYTKQKKYLSL